MRKITLIVILLLLHTTVFCQSRHSLSLLFDNFRLLKSPFPDAKQREQFLSFPGISYEYFPFKKFGFYINYNFWSGNLKFSNRPTIMVSGIIDENIGKIHERAAYKFINVGGSYRFINNKEHQINVDAGFSLAFGKDIYLDQINWTSLPDDPLRDFAGIVAHEKSGVYYGGSLGVKYGYNINSNYFVGCNVASQFFINTFSSQINYGIQFGYKF